MKKLLKYIILFLSPIVLIIIGIEIFYRTVPTNYSFKHQEILKHRDSIEVLIFGDSHAMYGINPKYLDKEAFNLANLSQTIYFDKLLFQSYVDQLPNLECIIIPMEYTTMSQADNTEEDIWRKYFYNAQMGLNVPIIKWYNPKKYSLALSQKMVRTVKALNTWRQTNTLVNCDNNGWGLGYNSSVDSLDVDRLAKVISRKHDDAKYDISQNLERVKSIVKVCKKKNINVILVNLPVTNQYFNLLVQDEVLEILKQSYILNAQNKHVKNLNLVQDPRFYLEDFQDVDHLNRNGAKKCSVILNEFIKDF